MSCCRGPSRTHDPRGLSVDKQPPSAQWGGRDLRTCPRPKGPPEPRCPKTPSPAETLRPGSSRMCGRMSGLSRLPARSPGVLVAPGRSGGPLGARSRLAGSSARARGRAGVAPGRQGGARCGSAGTDLVGRRRRPSPGRRTARSIGTPPALCGPAAPCPAPAVPSHGPASPRDRPVDRSARRVTFRPLTCAVRLPKPPYREGRQLGLPCEESNPTGRMRRGSITDTTRNAESAACNCRPSTHGRDTTTPPTAASGWGRRLSEPRDPTGGSPMCGACAVRWPVVWR